MLDAMVRFRESVTRENHPIGEIRSKKERYVSRTKQVVLLSENNF